MEVGEDFVVVGADGDECGVCLVENQYCEVVESISKFLRARPGLERTFTIEG